MFKNKHLKFIIALALFAGFSGRAFAHGDHHDGGEAELHELAELFDQAVRFEAEVFPDDGPAATLAPDWSRQKALRESGAFKMMSGWVRAYHRNVHANCDADHGIKDEDLMHAVEDEMLRSGMIQRFHQKLIEGAGELAKESADIGARLGRAALIAKVAAELAETALSKAAGGAGMHFICSAVDAVIVFGTRHMQTAYRTYAWAGQFEQSSTMAMMRSIYVRRKAQALYGKMKLVAGPIELDEEELEEIDEAGPNRWWGKASEGKRAKFMRKLAAAAEKNGTASEVFLREYYTGSKRMMRYLWLAKRHRGHALALKGDSPMESVLRDKGALWILQVQEGIINRANEHVTRLPPDYKPPAAEPSTPVVAGLIDELNEGLPLSEGQKTGLGLVLNDIEYIFDPTQSKTSRHVRVNAIETLLGVFIYRLMKAAGEEMDQMEAKRWRDIVPVANARWKQGRFVALVHEFADFMALASTSGASLELTNRKYAAQNYLIRIFSHLQVVRAKQAGLLTAEQMEESLEALHRAVPWSDRSEKREGRLFWKKAPLCENL